MAILAPVPELPGPLNSQARFDQTALASVTATGPGTSP